MPCFLLTRDADIRFIQGALLVWSLFAAGFVVFFAIT